MASKQMIYSLFESCIVILTTIFVNLVQFMVLQRGFKKKLKKFHFLPRYRRWNLEFGKKWRPRKFKSSISQNHVFEQKSRQESARNTKFGQVGGNNGTKKLQDLLFQNFAFFQNGGHFDPKLPPFWIKMAAILKKSEILKK